MALADVLTRQPVACVLTFDYGQRAAVQELTASRAIAAHYGLAHRVVELPWLSELLPHALTPKVELDAWGVVEASPQTQDELFDVNRVWVPNRNGLFLNIAASFAEAMCAQTVVFGANAEEGASFPDNTPEFRDQLNKTLSFSTLTGVRVETPVGLLSKIEIIQRGLALNVPFHLIWSCYENGDTQCGQCPSCLRVKAAKEQVRNLSGAEASIVFTES